MADWFQKFFIVTFAGGFLGFIGLCLLKLALIFIEWLFTGATTYNDCFSNYWTENFTPSDTLRLYLGVVFLVAATSAFFKWDCGVRYAAAEHFELGEW